MGKWDELPEEVGTKPVGNVTEGNVGSGAKGAEAVLANVVDIGGGTQEVVNDGKGSSGGHVQVGEVLVHSVVAGNEKVTVGEEYTGKVDVNSGVFGFVPVSR